MMSDESSPGSTSYLTVAVVLIRILDDRLIVWFDIDNTLYSATTKIAEAMGKLIQGLFTVKFNMCEHFA